MSPAPPSLPASGAVGAVTRAVRPPPAKRSPQAGEAEAAPPASPAAVQAAPPPESPSPLAVRTTIALTASPARAVVGHSVRLTAVVRAVGANSIPRGTVTFSANGALLGHATVRDGTAVLVTLNLEIGDHVLSAAYEGDGTHEPGQSASIAQTVARK
jgi:hypothetical protein